MNPLTLKKRDLNHTPSAIHQISQLNWEELERYVNILQERISVLENLDLSTIADDVYARVISVLFKKFTLNITLSNGASEEVPNPNDTENPWIISRTNNKYRISVIQNAMHVQIYNTVTLKEESCVVRIDDTFVEVEFDQAISDNMKVHITSL